MIKNYAGSGSNFLARRLTSLLILLLTAFSLGQPFGRFGYDDGVSLPGFVVERHGFRVNAKDADFFRFSDPTDDWRCTEISDMGKAAILSTKGRSPRKIRLNLLTPGFSLYFESGLSFIVDSEECPFLTWSGGSVGGGVPTPPTDWVLVSFSKSEPPVLLYFPNGKYSLRIDGSTGAWILRSVEVSAGWVRIVPPLGTEGAATSNARELGTLLEKVLPNLDVWIAQEPALLSLEVHSDDASVTASWHFDRALGVIPAAALLAPQGGYPVAITSTVRDLGLKTDEGPLEVSTSSDLVVKFPVLKLALGRALVAGTQNDQQAMNGYDDIPGIVQLALSNLESDSDPKTRDMAARLNSRFIGQVQNYREPVTGQQLPFQANGDGADISAAYALLLASTLAADGQDVRANAFTLSLLLKRDWNDWTIWCANKDLARRCSALASIACAIGGDERMRLDAGMLEAGLASQRGLELWRLGKDQPKAVKLSEPLDALRQGVFCSSQDNFVEALMSPVRIYADFPMFARLDPPSIFVRWLSQDTTPKEFRLSSSTPLQISKGKNVLTLATHPVSNGFSVRALPADIGFTEISLNSQGKVAIPARASPPAFSAER